MQNLRDFYARVAAEREKIPTETIFIISEDNPDLNQRAGGVCEASRDVAAQAIVRRSHRRATPEEIKGFHGLQERNYQEAQTVENRRELKRFVVVTPEMAAGLSRPVAPEPRPEPESKPEPAAGGKAK